MVNDSQLEPLKGARVLDISSSGDWLLQLRAAVESNAQTISLDMGKVEKIDTSCLQTLAAFVLAARQKDKVLLWVACSDNLKAAIEDLGLNRILSVEHG